MHTTYFSHFKSPKYNIFQNYKLVKKKKKDSGCNKWQPIGCLSTDRGFEFYSPKMMKMMKTLLKLLLSNLNHQI